MSDLLADILFGRPELRVAETRPTTLRALLGAGATTSTQWGYSAEEQESLRDEEGLVRLVQFVVARDGRHFRFGVESYGRVMTAAGVSEAAWWPADDIHADQDTLRRLWGG